MNKPHIICLCGSTRFFKKFQEINLRETLNGNIVLSIGTETQSDAELQLTDEQLERLGLLHLCKIDLCDEVYVIDIDNYIGLHTKREITYAIMKGKVIRYYSYEHRK